MNFKNLAMWAIIVFLTMGLYNLFKNPQNTSSQNNNITFSEFLEEVDNGRVVQVNIQGNSIKGVYSNGKNFNTYSPNDPNLIEKLTEKGVSISASPIDEKMPSLLGVLLSWFPMLLLIGVWIFFMRQMQGGKGGAMGFGRSKAKLMSDIKKKATFNDVAGIDEAKEEVEEVVEYLKNPKKFMKLGGKIPRGVLLVGSPGTGKTLLARAIAGEADVPFFTISGSDFVEMFVGVGASRVRDMFEQGKKNAPCIIFVDELDAVGRSRGAGLGGGNDEREQTLNQILVEMDGFETNDGVIIIAATNRPDVLDPALLRPGRFDRQVIVPLPDIVGRGKILKIHSKKISTGPDVKLKIVAKGTPGFSGADLANLVNEAALLAARKNKRIVTMQEFEEAKDKVMMGPERKSMVMTEEDKKLTAYHEGGHAIVAINEKASDPIHKATIIPRGRALGVVWTIPERDKYSHSREYLEANISKAMGGRIAEELIFGHDKVTSGASSDIQMATKLAKDMVTKFGMSDQLGPLTYGENEDEVFLGRSITRHQQMSEETANKVDIEIKKVVDTGYEKAKKIISTKIDDLHKLAKALLIYETLSGDEIKDLILKNIQPKRSNENDEEKKEETSALESLGLKPKPAV